MEYLLDIACRDYDFLAYGVDVRSGGEVLVYRVGRGGGVLGEKVVVGVEPVEVRVARGRDYYEARAGCEFLWVLLLGVWGRGWSGRVERGGREG